MSIILRFLSKFLFLGRETFLLNFCQNIEIPKKRVPMDFFSHLEAKDFYLINDKLIYFAYCRNKICWHFHWFQCKTCCDNGILKWNDESEKCKKWVLITENAKFLMFLVKTKIDFIPFCSEIFFFQYKIRAINFSF